MAIARHDRTVSLVAGALCAVRAASLPGLWQEGRIGTAVLVAAAATAGTALGLTDAFRRPADPVAGGPDGWLARSGWNHRLNGAAFCFFLASAASLNAESSLRARLYSLLGLSLVAVLAVAMWLDRPRSAQS